MKNFLQFAGVGFLCLVLNTTIVFAQTPPTPPTPTPPKTNSVSHTTSSSSSISTTNGVVKNSKNTNSSSSENGTTFKYRCTFDKRITPNVEAFLIKELGQPNYTNTWTTWKNKRISNFKVSLTRGKVRISYDKKYPEDTLVEDLKELTKGIYAVLFPEE